jgi:precorrin-2 dehydrogenase/sirohydrochlorin ferrochelatase
MLPLILDTKNQKILLIGEGNCADKREKMLQKCGVKNFERYKSPPENSAYKAANIVLVADVEIEKSREIYNTAKSHGAYVNVEDVPELCDFHVPAIVKRGDLLITSSTRGKSPRLARKIREVLERMFDESWEKNLNEISNARDEWKKQGLRFDTMSKATDKFIEEKNYFQKFCDRCKTQKTTNL